MIWPVTFQIPTIESQVDCVINAGEVVLFTGPNGVGKSALVHQIYRQLGLADSELFPGHRQIHFQSDDVETLGQTLDAFSQMRFTSIDNANRYRDAWSEIHLKSVVKRLVDRENQVNRDAISSIREYRAAASMDGETDQHVALTEKIKAAFKSVDENPSLINTLNVIFKVARLDVRLLLVDGVLRASRENNVYGLDRLSDGERAALLLVAAILVRPTNSIIIIDEPEKHLNPAIFGSLLAAAVRSRPDVGFVFCSHDLSLIDWLSPSVIMTIKRSAVTSVQPEIRRFEVYPVSPNDGVPEEVKRSILGVRKSVLFVEGETGSDDPLLYGLLYQSRSVVPKGGWESVIGSVRVLKNNPSYHWLDAVGLIDNDGRNEHEKAVLAVDGIFSLAVPSIENLYFLRPVLVAMAGAIHSLEGGRTAEQRVQTAEQCVPALLDSHRIQITYHQVAWMVNRILSERKVSVNALVSGQNGIDPIDIPSLIAERTAAYSVATATGSIEALESIPIKKTGIPAKLSEALGFRSFIKYKAAVLHQIDLKNDVGKTIVDAMRSRVPVA